jgi:LPS-assembly lipoprotein
VLSQDPYSPLAQSLSEALGRAGATPATAGAQDVATLRVASERWASTPLSVDQFGRAQEYTLRYAVVFRLNRADGSDLVPQQAIELSRDYISVPTNSSGTEGEREVLARELRREMVASILRRIDAASRQPTASAAATP